LQLNGVLQPPGTYEIAFAIEFEGNTAKQSFYATPPFSSSFGQLPIDDGLIGGALGNGLGEYYSHISPQADSNTYSIVSAIGNIVRLDTKTYESDLSGGTWTSYIRKNSILQDGSGGTVNTACVLSGSTLQNHSTFTLPVALTDHIDVLTIRTGTTAPFATAQVAVSVIFEAAIDGQFIICGGNSILFDNNLTTYQWNGTLDDVASEDAAIAPTGPTSFTVNGLYTEISKAITPGANKSWTSIVRQSKVDTSILSYIYGANYNASILKDVVFSSGQTINLSITPTGSPAPNPHYHWGLAATILVVPPAPSGGGIYYIKPNKTNDTLYYGFYGGTGYVPTVSTKVVAIPNPFVIL